MELKAAAPDTEYDQSFLQGMLDRVAVSFHKYGSVEVAFPDRVDAMASAQQRMETYLATGNTEFLIDAANFLMFEFMRPRLPGAFFEPTDSAASPGRITTSGNVAKRDRNERLIRKPLA